MSWTPPLIAVCQRRHCRSIDRTIASTLLIATTAFSGCATLPSLPASRFSQDVATAPRTGDTVARIAALPPAPEFDVLRETPQVAIAPPSSKVIAPAPPAIAGAATKGMALPDATPKAKTDGATSRAAAKPSVPPVTAPAPFAWQSGGKSDGSRQLQTVRVGEDGYRSLVVGSIAGDDPLAIELVDQLARRLHDDHVILGGFDSTVIRTLNPDGAANRKVVNQSGIYLNESFPKPGAVPAELPREIAFVLERMNTTQPQRVLHVRTIAKERGIIAASSSCKSVADEAADWLGFSRLDLTAKSAEGSLERYITSNGTADMITVAIPASTRPSELWTRYGDTLLNLLLGEDLATREIARGHSQQSSADRRK